MGNIAQIIPKINLQGVQTDKISMDCQLKNPAPFVHVLTLHTYSKACLAILDLPSCCFCAFLTSMTSIKLTNQTIQ